MRLGPIGDALLKTSVPAILFAVSCGGGGSCGGSGCGGCGGGNYQFPINDPSRPDAIVQPQVARLRITQTFLDFIRPQLPAILKAELGSTPGASVDANNVLHYPIADTSFGGLGFTVGTHATDALIFLDDIDNNLTIQFETPSDIHLTVTHLRVGVSGTLQACVPIAGCGGCPLTGTIGPGPEDHAAEISLDMHIDPNVGPDPMRALNFGVQVSDVSLDQLSITVPGGNGFICDTVVGSILNIASDLVNLIRPLLNTILKPILQNLVANALNGLNGKTAKIQQQIDVAKLLNLSSSSHSNPFGILIAADPGTFPVVDRGTGLGMEVTTSGGAEGKLADCIGDLPDFVPMKGPIPDLMGTDSMMRPYHIGLTLASSLLNQMLYAAHRSGSLCIKLGTEDVRNLTKGKFTMNAALLSLLSADVAKLATDKAPVILELKPRQPGHIALGSGMKTGQDAMGHDIYDWLIKLDLNQMGIAFHVLMQDRYVRLFEVTTDIHLGINLTILPDNKLEANIGNLKLDNFSQTFNEILPNADFGMLLPSLIEIATQALLSNALKFDLDVSSTLSNALHGAPIYMRINDIFRDGMNQDYLTLTITFTSTPSHLMLAADTRAELAKNDGLVERNEVLARPTGVVRLLVGNDPARPLEYQASVDGGLWRTFTAPSADGIIVFEDAHLFISGAHTIDVRARYAGEYTTLDPTPASLTAIVDPNPPTLEARILGDHVAVSVVDRETPIDEELTLEGRLDDGTFFALPLSRTGDEIGTRVASFALSAAGTAKNLYLRASDPRGNVSKLATVHLGLEASTATEHQGGCGCSATESRATGGTLALLACLSLLSFLRRFRRSH
jgi:hypothetical protein